MWAREKIEEFNLQQKCSILFSPVFGEIDPVNIVEWILEDKLDARFQLQLHKYIWKPETRGV